MKKLILILFSLLMFMTCYSQSPYNTYGPASATEPAPSEMTPDGFQFDKEVMSKITYNKRIYKGDEISSQKTINSDLDDMGLTELGIQIIDHKNSVSLIHDTKATDTISYQPFKDEIIFQHISSKQLFDTPYDSHTIDELIFVNNGKVIASQDPNNFIKYFYEDSGKLDEIMTYESSLVFSPVNENGEHGIPVTSLTPNTYVRIGYNDNDKIVSKWIYSDQSFYFPNSNTDYNETLILLHYSGSYNDDNEVAQKVITSYRFKNLKEGSKEFNELNQKLENPETIRNFDELNKFYYSKEITTIDFKHDNEGKIIAESFKTEYWNYKNDIAVKKDKFETTERTRTQNGNTIIIDEKLSSIDDTNNLIVQFTRDEYITDDNQFLVEYNHYNKNNEQEEYELSRKEQMTITYK